jgi:hypothetical protein
MKQAYSMREAPPVPMEKVKLSMIKKGWIIWDEQMGKPFASYLKFCKDGIAASFDARGPYGEDCMRVSVGWSMNPLNDTYCPR